MLVSLSGAMIAQSGSFTVQLVQVRCPDLTSKNTYVGITQNLDNEEQKIWPLV